MDDNSDDNSDLGNKKPTSRFLFPAPKINNLSL